MHVLALNPGSSSLRFQIVAVERDGAGVLARKLGGGSVAGIGAESRARTRVENEAPRIESTTARDHVEALDWALAWLTARALRFESVGVRIVHGGGSLVEAAEIDEAVLASLRRACELAPLHDRPSLRVIEQMLRVGTSRTPVAAVFETAFFSDLPEVARVYPLPQELTLRHGIRRLGFHGIALRSVIARMREGGTPLPRRIVAAHLGGGASVTALLDGHPIDTSMGFSPLEGLMMATRSGDIDPTLVALLSDAERRPAAEIVEMLNLRSGLLGVSGVSGDMATIEQLRAEGEPRATLAFELFVHRARKHLAGMMAVLGGADALVFSGGIGENSPATRAAMLHGMEWCGVALDEDRNRASEPVRCITREGSKVAAHVIGADEESWIARAAFELQSKLVR